MKLVNIGKLLNGSKIKTKNSKGYLRTKIINNNLIKVSYFYKRKTDKKYRYSNLLIRRFLKLNKENIYRIALIASEGSHLSKEFKPKTNYFKFTNTNKQIFKEGLIFLKNLIPKSEINFELRYPEKMKKEDAISQWSKFLNEDTFNFSVNKKSSLSSCSIYINKVFLSNIIDKIIWITLEKIENNKDLLTSWFAGRIDGDGTIHSKSCRIDIAYHKDEIKLLKIEKKFLDKLNIKYVKDRISNKKQLIVLQICSLDNIIKLFDKFLSFENKSKINSLFKKTEFYLQLKKNFRESLTSYHSTQIKKINLNRYLNGSRKIPFSSLCTLFNGKVPFKEVEKLRYGTRTIANREIIKQLLDKKFHYGGKYECVV